MSDEAVEDSTRDLAAEGTLAERAQARRVVVVGGGVSGLVAALECAKVGIAVTVLEASRRLGGTVRTVELDGMPVDLTADAFAVGSADVGAVVAELGLDAQEVRPDRADAWIAGLAAAGAATDAAPLPAETIAGIPENPWDARVRRIIGWGGAWRAYLDRLRPPLTIGRERSLGRLVETRMGDRVLHRMVAPVAFGRHAIAPDDVDVERVAPGLSAALTRIGSLGGAVAQLRGERGDDSPLRGLDGGMQRLVDALADRLAVLGADVRQGERAAAISRRDDARWEVAVERTDESDDAAVVADAVVLAVDEDAARRLAASVTRLGVTARPHVALEVVTLVVDAPELDAAPRGDTVYAVPGALRAAAAVQLTVRWSWLRALAGGGRHVVRVVFGGPGDAPATADLDGDELVSLAASAASSLLGVALDPSRVRDWHRGRYDQPRTSSHLGRADEARADRAEIHDATGLFSVGAWLAGPGLAQVIPDAVEEAERVRRLLLWGDGSAAPRPRERT